MDSWRLTRRQLVKRGVAASIVVAVGVDAKVATAAPAASSGVGADGVLPGVLARVIDHQTALVTVAGQGVTRVTLGPRAFVAHGVEGKVADFSRFLPGERVAVRGSMSDGTLKADEFQSIYTEDSGTLAIDQAGRRTVNTSSGLDLPGVGGIMGRFRTRSCRLGAMVGRSCVRNRLRRSPRFARRHLLLSRFGVQSQPVCEVRAGRHRSCSCAGPHGGSTLGPAGVRATRHRCSSNRAYRR